MQDVTCAAGEEVIPEVVAEELADAGDFANLNRQRAAGYGLLSRLFRVEIDEALLAELKTTRFPVNTGNADLDEGYTLMAKYLGTTWENSLLDLAVDYTRAFIGRGLDGFSAAYPYESVYTSEKRLLMQAAREDVLALYHSMGIEKDDSWKEAEDHLAVELEFMQILSLRAAEALEAGNEDEAVELMTVQKTFIDEHLLNWVPRMLEDMLEFVKTDFYCGLGKATKGFIEMDKALLEDIILEEE